MTETPLGFPPTGSETYIGDGLYASFDGFTIWLRAPREGGDHRIALEPVVYQSLLGWLADYPALKRHVERG